MAKIVRLTESDLIRLVKKVMKEQHSSNPYKEPKMSDFGFDNIHGDLGPDDEEDFDDYHQDVEDFSNSDAGEKYRTAKKRYDTTNRMERLRKKRSDKISNMAANIGKRKSQELGHGSDEHFKWLDDTMDKMVQSKDKKLQKKDEFTKFDFYDLLRKNK
jgi:hypothetical protein